MARKKVTAHTPRPRRKGERDGREYHFVTPPAFERMAARGRFACVDVDLIFDHAFGDPDAFLRDVLLARGYEAHYAEFSGGHDLVCYRGQLAEGLLALMGLRQPGSGA